MIVFRQADPRFPFLWSDASQPAGRWHGEGDGPAHYFADTPDGAWAELLRHEEITEPEDIATVRRALWAIDIGDDRPQPVSLTDSVVTGAPETYPKCQAHAAGLRAKGARRLIAASAALRKGSAGGYEVAAGVERPAAPRDGRVVVIFGPPDDLRGWKVVERGSPPLDVLARVRHFRS